MPGIIFVHVKVDLSSHFILFQSNAIAIFFFHLQLECREGWYGDNCSQQFTGHCIDGTTCNHVTGLCDGGCDTGWTGSVCDKGLLEIQLNIILIMCIFNFL